MFRRGNYFWSHDGETGKQETLRTKDKATALRLLHSKKEAYQQPILNLQIARTYLTASDPEIGKRTWQTVMNEIVLTKKDATRVRWDRAIKDKAFDLLRDRPLLETRAEHFLDSLRQGTVSTNVHLRKLHNFALDMNWLPWSVNNASLLLQDYVESERKVLQMAKQDIEAAVEESLTEKFPGEDHSRVVKAIAARCDKCIAPSTQESQPQKPQQKMRVRC